MSAAAIGRVLACVAQWCFVVGVVVLTLRHPSEADALAAVLGLMFVARTRLWRT